MLEDCCACTHGNCRSEYKAKSLENCRYCPEAVLLQDAAKLTPEQETTLLSAREMMLGRTAMLASQQQPLLVRLQASLLLP